MCWVLLPEWARLQCLFYNIISTQQVACEVSRWWDNNSHAKQWNQDKVIFFVELCGVGEAVASSGQHIPYWALLFVHVEHSVMVVYHITVANVGESLGLTFCLDIYFTSPADRFWCQTCTYVPLSLLLYQWTVFEPHHLFFIKAWTLKKHIDPSCFPFIMPFWNNH